MRKVKLNVWVSEEQMNYLKLTAINQNQYLANIVRDCIEVCMVKSAVQSSLDKVCNIIDKQIEISLSKYLDRIIKLVVKSGISSESANYNTTEILASVRKQDKEEIKEISRKVAIRYLQKGSDDI